MGKIGIIKPDVMNIICRKPEPSPRIVYEPMLVPEPNRKNNHSGEK